MGPLASLIGTANMKGVKPYAYLRDLFISLANGHLAKDIDALMPLSYAQRISAHNELVPEAPTCSLTYLQATDLTVASRKSMGRRRRIQCSRL